MSNSKHELIFVTGIPGSGKSHMIQNDSYLSSLPKVDIQDIYVNNPDMAENCLWQEAQDEMLKLAVSFLQSGTSDVVCEAILLPGTWSRSRLESLLRDNDIPHRFIEIQSDYQTCMKRIRRDYNNEKIKIGLRFDKRASILRSYLAKGLIQESQKGGSNAPPDHPNHRAGKSQETP